MCLIVQFLFYISWEQCELGKIANEVTRTDPESTAPIMMITANNGFIEQSDRYAFDNAGESLKKYILLEKGELAYNHGASKLRPYGSCFALTTVEKARIPFVYHCFSAKNYNSEFLSIELNGENVEKQLRRIVSSGARMDGLLNISFTEYSTITLSLPKRKEQDKISNFFSILDNLITLHQRKQIKQNLGVLPEKCCTKITNSWEQRKLGEIANIQKGQQLGKAEMSSTGTYYVLNGGMEASGFTNQYNTLANTISISEGGNSCGYVSLNLEHFWSGGHNYTLQNLKINTIFLYQWLKRQEKRIMALRVGSGLPNIQKSSLQDVYVKYSTTTEQQAIALFLIKIDNLITLHQCKYFNPFSNFSSHLVCFEKYKKANSWEQRKLCGIAEKVLEKNKNTSITETFTNSAEFGIISQRDYFDHDISNINNLSDYYVVQNDDFIYNPRISANAPVGPINRNKLGRKGVMSPLYTVFRASNIDFAFLEWYFKSEHWHGFMKFNGDSGARSDRFSIKDEIMFQMPLPYPNINEQERVGKFLSKIDNLITLHQRKLKDFHGGFL